MWKNFLFTGLIFGLCCLIFFITITKIDPLGPQKNIAYFSFFISYFFGIVSFFTLLFFFSSEIILKKKLGQRAFLISIRRSSLVGVFAGIIATLQIMRLLDLFEMLMIALLFLFVELIFLFPSKKELQSSTENKKIQNI